MKGCSIMQGIVIHKDTDTSQNNTETLAELLSIDAQWSNSKDATLARYRGILAAKTQALFSVSFLHSWGKFLSWSIIFISAIHVWESISTIKPDFVTALKLPDTIYHLAALLFTLMIDVCVVFIVKSNSACAYVGAQPNKASIFFYIVTGLLNGVFISSHTPVMNEDLRGFVIPVLGTIFVFLLPASVPIAIYAVEQSNQMLEAAKLKLTVDIATLRGMVNVKENEEMTQQDATNKGKDLCMNCKASVTHGEFLASTRWGYCKHCKDAVIAERNKVSENH